MPLYNRTQRAFSLFYDALVVTGAKLKLDLQVYKFTSNEYRFFPITVNVNACAEYARNTFGMKDLLSKTSNMNFCNLKKGFNYVKNAIPDFSKYPPHLPRGMYKIACTFKTDSRTSMQLDFYGAIKDKPDYWKRLL
ncbi:hypothetical protein ILUMI_10454 [Ignelater luminosus]|uniref:Uncharacterized protein n=1 Tax=Ignelater luminosus TaxID=2038154 RepID=A0A8K0GBG6_IGNLU|nr:hypothetical protein ILUMI_10454 [Ignelater luminosus]